MLEALLALGPLLVDVFFECFPLQKPLLVVECCLVGHVSLVSCFHQSLPLTPWWYQECVQVDQLTSLCVHYLEVLPGRLVLGQVPLLDIVGVRALPGSWSRPWRGLP